MLPYIAEFLGTMMLIILGDGVVANVNLNKSGMKGAGAVQITLAWGLAVLVPASSEKLPAHPLIRHSQSLLRLTEVSHGLWCPDM